VGNTLGECHAPCTLKISFVDFEKEQAHCSRYKRLNISSLSNSPVADKLLTSSTWGHSQQFCGFLGIFTSTQDSIMRVEPHGVKVRRIDDFILIYAATKD
jgi:hypothetical protein